MSSLDSLYQEIILDHSKRPRNAGRLEAADIQRRGYNPLCGDEVELFVDVEDGRIADVRQQGRGCAISQASASMLTNEVKGKSLDDVERLITLFKEVMLSRDPAPAKDTGLGELEALQGVKQYPVRIKCALLAWNTLGEGIEGLQKARRSLSFAPESAPGSSGP